MMSDQLQLNDISLAYDSPEGVVPVVDGLNLHLQQGHIG
ncbi:MAG: ABC transporter ATP-binding protein, partial [Ramlibacter sp.]|nr:ABC transporter ATP-binding protein [Ramlibacter sp.]